MSGASTSTGTAPSNSAMQAVVALWVRIFRPTKSALLRTGRTEKSPCGGQGMA